MGKLVYGAIMPHPPILVPEIGKARLKEAKASAAGMAEIARCLVKCEIDTLIIVTPHGAVGQASVPVYTGHVFEGNLGQFGLAKPVFHFKGDPALGMAVIKDSASAASCPETLLDHGVLVPLSYVKAAGYHKAILPVAIAYLPLPKLFEFGQSLAQTIKRLPKNVAVVASADMSHRLTADAPSGYSPRGKEFDDKLVALVKNYDVNGILDFDPQLADDAGQDALWSIAILLGALSGLSFKHEVISYEGPFGVGYMTAVFEVN